MDMFIAADPIADVASGQMKRSRQVLVVILVGLVACAVAWQIVNLALMGGFGYWAKSGEGQRHLALTWTCLALAVCHALSLRGPLDFKMKQALVGAPVIFGLYALAILGGRLPFSRPLLVSTLIEAMVMAQAAVLIRHGFAPPKVAIIGPLTRSANLSVPVTVTVISDPQADLRNYDLLLVSFTGTVSADWASALASAMLSGAKVRHVGEYVEELRGAVSLEHFNYEHLPPNGITSYRLLKRGLDVALAIFILAVALPILLISMAAILIMSGRPVFFVQERVGAGGRAFHMWKLRTMKPHSAGQRVDPALPGDPRVTRVGRVLRRFRVDELPQLLNVLRGDMSLIGPRPEAAALHHEYRSQLPNYDYRYLVRPGITGWAQINTTPSANAEEAYRKLAFDLFYVKKLSLFLDLQILLRTIWTVASGGGAR
jgi:lipopolysaccharide/colanic/teichoic acid biosynthesis glycosyltransferase